MKSIVVAVAAASALSVSLAAYSQTDSTPTRAQVRAELQQLEQVGYNPANSDDATYPSDIQAAEARVEANQTAYGGVPSGTSRSSSSTIVRPASADEMKQLYFGGQ
jgi:hypothetical protein